VAELPSGTVTFMMTDVEGSTRLWEAHPGIMADVLARHDALAAAAIAENRGFLIKSRGEGDSLFAVFARATDAVAAALAFQQALTRELWPAETPLRVRVALHTGEADLREGDYYGRAVNRCARLRAAAHGGQVLLTAATQEVVQDTLPRGAGLKSLGEHRLRDLDRPEPVYQLLHPSLPAEFDEIRSAEYLPTNLPLQLTSFVGREKEMADLDELLRSSRLLTVTGAGGVGKTRLALQVAAEMVEQFQDGVWLVELGPLSDSALVPQALAAALKVREEPGRTLVQTLTDHLKPRSVLLVLDNCEHLLDACARISDTILRSCPRVKILATSREGLGIAGEMSFRIPSLSMPDPLQHRTAQSLSGFESVLLFLDRARAAQPSFALTDQNAPAVAQICSRLDGIPLAIELAAARVKAMSVDQISARLDDRFRLLTGGSRTALPRQQTLRATIDWSYDLLSEKEKVLLRRLSVFAGGWTLEAAEKVCADPVE